MDPIYTQEQFDNQLRVRLADEVAKVAKAKDEQITQLRAELETKGTELAEAQKAKNRLEELEPEFTKLQSKDITRSRSDALGEAGLDKKLHGSAIALFEQHKAENPDATFEAWVAGAAREHPLLEDRFTAAGGEGAGGGAGGAGGAGESRRGHNANGNTAQNTPDGQGVMTGQQLHDYFESDEYKALPRDKKREKIAELKAQDKQGVTA